MINYFFVVIQSQTNIVCNFLNNETYQLNEVRVCFSSIANQPEIYYVLDTLVLFMLEPYLFEVVKTQTGYEESTVKKTFEQIQQKHSHVNTSLYSYLEDIQKLFMQVRDYQAVFQLPNVFQSAIATLPFTFLYDNDAFSLRFNNKNYPVKTINGLNPYVFFENISDQLKIPVPQLIRNIHSLPVHSIPLSWFETLKIYIETEKQVFNFSFEAKFAKQFNSQYDFANQFQLNLRKKANEIFNFSNTKYPILLNSRQSFNVSGFSLLLAIPKFVQIFRNDTQLLLIIKHFAQHNDTANMNKLLQVVRELQHVEFENITIILTNQQDGDIMTAMLIAKLLLHDLQAVFPFMDPNFEVKRRKQMQQQNPQYDYVADEMKKQQAQYQYLKNPQILANEDIIRKFLNSSGLQIKSLENLKILFDNSIQSASALFLQLLRARMVGVFIFLTSLQDELFNPLSCQSSFMSNYELENHMSKNYKDDGLAEDFKLPFDGFIQVADLDNFEQYVYFPKEVQISPEHMIFTPELVTDSVNLSRLIQQISQLDSNYSFGSYCNTIGNIVYKQFQNQCQPAGCVLGYFVEFKNKSIRCEERELDDDYFIYQSTGEKPQNNNTYNFFDILKFMFDPKAMILLLVILILVVFIINKYQKCQEKKHIIQKSSKMD